MKNSLISALNALMFLTIGLALVLLLLNYTKESTNCAQVVSIMPAATDRYFYTLSDGTKWWSTAVYQINDRLCQVN